VADRRPAGYDAPAAPDAPRSSANGSDGKKNAGPLASPDTDQHPQEGRNPKPFANPGRKGKGDSTSEVPDRIRVLKDVLVATQSGTISFVAEQVVTDKHLIAALQNSDAQFEPC